MDPTPFNVSTALLIAFACWVIYLRLKGNSDTNIPLIYYGIVVYYVIAYDTQLQPTVVYIAVVLGLLLRFEFMNVKFMKAVSVLECCALGTIIYFNLATILAWY
jgi:hypothetical protein